MQITKNPTSLRHVRRSPGGEDGRLGSMAALLSNGCRLPLACNGTLLLRANSVSAAIQTLNWIASSALPPRNDVPLVIPNILTVIPNTPPVIPNLFQDLHHKDSGLRRNDNKKTVRSSCASWFKKHMAFAAPFAVQIKTPSSLGFAEQILRGSIKQKDPSTSDLWSFAQDDRCIVDHRGHGGSFENTEDFLKHQEHQAHQDNYCHPERSERKRAQSKDLIPSKRSFTIVQKGNQAWGRTPPLQISGEQNE